MPEGSRYLAVLWQDNYAFTSGLRDGVPKDVPGVTERCRRVLAPGRMLEHFIASRDNLRMAALDALDDVGLKAVMHVKVYDPVAGRHIEFVHVR
jgi:hypothetical protein